MRGHFQEDRSRIFALLLLILIFIVLILPYLVVYILPFLVLSAALGWILLKACYLTEATRNHARLAYLVPLAVVIANSTLAIMAPEAFHCLQFLQSNDRNVGAQKRVEKPPIVRTI